MIFMPEQRRIGLALASSGVASYSKSPQWIEWSDLFPNHDPEGIEEGSVQPAQLRVYPNPVSSVLHVVTSTCSADKLVLFDVSGRLQDVCFSQMSDGLFTVDVTGLSTGVYLVVNNSGETPERVSLLVLK
jgi:hypothetical protein